MPALDRIEINITEKLLGTTISLDKDWLNHGMPTFRPRRNILLGYICVCRLSRGSRKERSCQRGHQASWTLSLRNSSGLTGSQGGEGENRDMDKGNIKK